MFQILYVLYLFSYQLNTVQAVCTFGICGDLCNMLCAAGTYCNRGVASCSGQSCPSGAYCPAGVSAGIPCPAGRYGLYDCVLYLSTNCYGTRQTSLATGCPNQCPAGTWGIAGEATLQAACIYSCPQGTWGTAIGAGTQAIACPNSCPGGTWSSLTGQTSTAACNQLCPAGTWGTSGVGAVSTACPNKCPAGTWGTAVGQTTGAACTNRCPAGTFGTVLGGSTQAGACDGLCPSGTYSAASGLTSNSGCVSCPAGKISVAGQSECTPCTAGYQCPSVGTKTAATECPAGTYSNSGQSECTPCAPGSFSGGVAATCTPCTACAAGNYLSFWVSLYKLAIFYFVNVHNHISINHFYWLHTLHLHHLPICYCRCGELTVRERWVGHPRTVY